MFRTAATGNVGSRYADEVVGVSQGTVVEEQDKNIVQEELVKAVIGAGLSIETSPGTVENQLLEAMEKLVAERGKQLGELFYLDQGVDPSAWDRDNPEDYFAGVPLDEGDLDLNVANWPDLVPHLLARALTYNEGISGERSAFDVTDWDVAANVGTLTFANWPEELKALAALVEDNLVHGSFASWRSVTLAGVIGNIPAGTYALDAVDAVARTVTFDVTASNGSGSVTETVQFLIHAIEGSALARVFEYPAGVLVAANDGDGEAFAGLRRRDRGQGHWHEKDLVDYTALSGAGTAGVTGVNPVEAPPFTIANNAITDGTNGTPRTGLTTDPRSYVGKLYLWGRRFIA